MRSNVFIILISLTFFSVNGVAKDTLIMSGHPDFNPVMYRQDSEIIGIGVELAEKIFSELNIKTESIYAGPWKRVQKRAESADIDFIVGIYKNRAREQYLDYIPTPFMDNPASIFVMKEKQFEFSQWGDLIGKTGGQVRGDKYRQDFEDFLIEHHIKHQLVNTMDQNIGKLRNGRIDYFAYGTYPILIKLKKEGLSNEIVPLDTPLYVGQFYFAFSKQSLFKKHINAVNDKVIEYKGDGTIQRIVDKWLNK
ncbi:transporter substrate-binding domain-containing protein [Vibrio profundum]|uniref:substrate-binding periplasmic protein n=1 Tax=Vibrio profundum TaxID=2910247 RepID=UPI003D0F6787